jgi:hypothetical protein
MNRPIINMAMLVAPAWRELPRTDTKEPTMMVQRRPNMSANNMLKTVPAIAPPWKADTIPPMMVSDGSLKYSLKVGSAIVDVMMPESYPKRTTR